MLKSKNWINTKNISTVAILLLLFIASFISISISSEKPLEGADLSKTVQEENLTEEKPSTDFFKEVSITARAVIVWDIKNQKTLFEHNAKKSLPLASVTKTLMALTAYDLLPDNTEIQIEKNFLEAEGDSGLLVDERWKMKDLINFSLITSSNDAALAIASIAGALSIDSQNFEAGREVFVSRMNKKAQELNLESVVIKNESGLDKDNLESGAYGSAKDIARFFEYLLREKPEILEATSLSEADFTSLNGKNHKVKNTNVILDEIPGIIASKTGFTSLAGGNLAVIFDAILGRPIIIVVLGSSFEDRFTDILKLSEATIKTISEEPANY